MAHLYYFRTRVAGVNFCFFIAVPSGGGCGHYAKCEMRNCVTQNRRQNEHAKRCGIPQNGEMEKVASDAPGLTAMAVAMHSRHRFSKR